MQLRVRPRTDLVRQYDFCATNCRFTRICESASGVVRTGRLTAGGATRPEFPWLAEDHLPQRISMMPTELRAERGAPRW